MIEGICVVGGLYSDRLGVMRLFFCCFACGLLVYNVCIALVSR